MIILLVPFFVWIAANLSFFNGHAFISGDNPPYFHYIIHHVQALSRGVFPLWNPYHAWGSMDVLNMRGLGDFNPFFLLSLVPMGFGVDPYFALLAVVVLYFLFGCIGFYVLARQVTGDLHAAFLAYVLFMFSNLGIILFEQFVALFIFVPAVWFFVFLLGFLGAGSTKARFANAVGLTFSLMLILTTYIPFFFLTVFLCVLTAALIFAPQNIISSFKVTADFCLKFPFRALMCFMLIVLSALPSVLWYLDSKGSEYVLTMGRSLDANKDVLTVSPAMINSGSLCAQTSWEEMFANFDAGSNARTYVPVFVFIVFLLSFFGRIRRQKLVLFGAGLLLFFIAAADVTPLQRFLYDHCVMFRSFRNYYFFIPFLTAMIILFLAGELKEFLFSNQEAGRSAIRRVIYVLFTHAFFFVFLLRIEGVPVSSFVTVVLSAGWLCLWCAGLLSRHKNILTSGLAVILLIQPLQVLPQYARSFPQTRLQHPLAPSVFSYLRPVKGNGFNEADGYSYTKLYLDDSGFFNKNYLGNRVSYDLQKNVPPQFLKDYVQYKFLIYDKASFMGPHAVNWVKLAAKLSSFADEALVQDIKAQGGRDMLGNALGLTSPSDLFKVEHFDLNDIKIRTNFADREFLVYNDSFHTDWEAFIDGKRVSVYRANMAFKGVWVDPGVHHIVFSFRQWMQVFYVFLYLLFGACFAALVYLWRREIRW